jgi:hypothetical protein
MQKRGVLLLVVASALLSVLSTGAAAKEFKYTGVRDCSRCHKKDLIGDQTKVWKGTQHSKAFKTLKGDEAVKIAKERGMTELPHESEACLRCHATAQGVPPEKVEAKSFRLADGVQCESCHGPGSEYKGNEIMSDHALSVAAGMWEPGKEEKICLGCHNDESPTFKPFDYEERKKKIAHPIPEDVKGRYLALEEAQGGKKKRRRE